MPASSPPCLCHSPQTCPLRPPLDFPPTGLSPHRHLDTPSSFPCAVTVPATRRAVLLAPKPSESAEFSSPPAPQGRSCGHPQLPAFQSRSHTTHYGSSFLLVIVTVSYLYHLFDYWLICYFQHRFYEGIILVHLLTVRLSVLSKVGLSLYLAAPVREDWLMILSENRFWERVT